MKLLAPSILSADFWRLGEQIQEVIENSHIVVELVGGRGFAKDLIKEALQKGRHVVTANKHLLAEEGVELFQMAEEKGLCVGVEALLVDA